LDEEIAMKTRDDNLKSLTSIGVWSRPSGPRGGDFIIRHETPRSLTVILGDATGHGEEGAGVATYIRPIIRREIVFGVNESVLRRWNHLVYRRHGEENRFVCITVLKFDFETRLLSVINGGNPDVLIHRKSSGLKRSRSTGMPLGLLDPHEWFPPKMEYTWLGAQDYVVGFTDGLVDCVGKDGNRFGLRRVCTALRGTPGSVLRTLRRGLLGFRSPTAEQDDVSMLVLSGRHCLAA
jgi:serine phosphatase RsbU (regulator of sigma subunit)